MTLFIQIFGILDLIIFEESIMRIIMAKPIFIVLLFISFLMYSCRYLPVPKDFLDDEIHFAIETSNRYAMEIGADSYLWSTGDTTNEIEITKEGIIWLEIEKNGQTYRDSAMVVFGYSLVQLQTTYGNILLYLHPETPIHKETFLDLVRSKYLDDQTFNRVIDGFVIQGGCPDPVGYENGGLFTDTSRFIPAEFNEKLKHIPGALGGGRDDNPQMRTNSCQFYICDSTDRDMSRLDMKYTIFGKVVEGMDVVQKISEVATNEKDQPLKEIIIKAKVVVYTPEELRKQFGLDIQDI